MFENMFEKVKITVDNCLCLIKKDHIAAIYRFFKKEGISKKSHFYITLDYFSYFWTNLGPISLLLSFSISGQTSGLYWLNLLSNIFYAPNDANFVFWNTVLTRKEKCTNSCKISICPFREVFAYFT